MKTVQFTIHRFLHSIAVFLTKQHSMKVTSGINEADAKL